MKKILICLLMLVSIKGFTQANYQFYKATIGAGLYFKTMPANASALDSAVYVDRATGEFQIRKVPASSSATIYTADGRLSGNRHISGGPSGYSLLIDSSSSISLLSGLEFTSSGIGSVIQMSDSVMNIGSTSATDFTSFVFSPTRIKFTAADGAGNSGDVWTNTGSGYGHWAPGGGGGITSINSSTGPAIVIQGGTGIGIDNSVPDYVTVNVIPSSSALIHSLIEFYTDANNTGTGETDLYSYTSPSGTLAVDGQKITFEFAGLLNDATATSNLQIYFAGTAIGGTGAVSTTTGAWTAKGFIIRASSSTARAYVTFTMEGSTGKVFTSVSSVGGVDFTDANIIKVTGTAGGGTGGSNDITAKMGYIMFIPIPI